MDIKLNKFIGKDYNEVLDEALKSLSLTENDVLITNNNIKKGVFKTNFIELTVTPLTDVLKFLKDYLNEILTLFGLKVKFEDEIKDKQIKIKMYSDDNPILIGNQGKTLASLEVICKQAVRNKFGAFPYISFDVENYKDKQLMYLKKTAIRIAKEVSITHIPVEMDPMNSYERLIIHNAVSDIKGVYTESVGEGKERHIIINWKEED